MKTKICKTCGLKKEVSEFYSNIKKYKNNEYLCFSSNCKSCNRIIEKEKYIKNKDKISEYNKNFYLKNRERIKNRNNNWNKKNKKSIQKAKHKLRKNNQNYQLAEKIRNRINDAIRYNYKSEKSFNLLGCSIIKLKNYLKIDNNYSGKEFHIDHIIPCSLYNLAIPEEQKKCFNYRNLRIIPAKENITKSNKLDFDLIKQYNIQDLLPEKTHA